MTDEEIREEFHQVRAEIDAPEFDLPVDMDLLREIVIEFNRVAGKGEATGIESEVLSACFRNLITASLSNA
ncbi:hypothetical protein BH11ARM2_BH11ARM2_29570 [soil metagenome]